MEDPPSSLLTLPLLLMVVVVENGPITLAPPDCLRVLQAQRARAPPGPVEEGHQEQLQVASRGRVSRRRPRRRRSIIPLHGPRRAPLGRRAFFSINGRLPACVHL